MDRRKISFNLFFILLMPLMMIIGCGGSGGGAVAPVKYFQTDLEGTWNFQLLESGNTNGWSRGTVTINEAGTLAFEGALEDSSGGSSAPVGPIVWTISGTTGAITERDGGTATTAHYSITSNNNLIAGTATGSSKLFVIQKVGTSYAAADIQGKSFVFHELSTGATKEWTHGEGSTDGAGAITISSETTPSGVATPGATGVTLSLDTANGIVTMNEDMSTFKGLLSADKKTIVGTYTDGSDYKMMIIQITGKAYTAGTLPAATWNAHGLVVGNGGSAPLWIRYLATVNSSGTVSLSSVESNQSGISLVLPDSYPGGTLSAEGEITFTSDTSGFHGQVSDDETFMVATQTPYTDDASNEYHSLTIYTDIR
jgi:hypothetical protein